MISSSIQTTSSKISLELPCRLEAARGRQICITPGEFKGNTEGSTAGPSASGVSFLVPSDA